MGIVNYLAESFHRVFESESDRKLRRAQAISKTEAVLEQSRRQYESHARRYRDKAVESLRMGSKGNFEAFKRDLKRCVGSERRIAQLQLAFAGAVQRAEEVHAMSEFCHGMTAVSRALQDAMKGIDLSGALKNFAAVTAKTQNIESGIDEFLNIANRMSMAESFAGGEELVTDKEIDEMLRREAAMAERGEPASGLDAEISNEMRELERLQKELGGR